MKAGEGCRKLWMFGNILLGSGKMSRGFFHWRKVFRVKKLHVQTHEYLKEHSTVSSLHAHLQVANFQRCELVFVCNWFMCLVCGVMYVHPLRVAVCVCALLHRAGQSAVVQYHYFKPTMSRSKRKAEMIQLVLLRCVSCCTILLYFSRYCTVRLKMFSLFFCCLCNICVKSIKNLSQYSTMQPIVLVEYLG